MKTLSILYTIATLLPMLLSAGEISDALLAAGWKEVGKVNIATKSGQTVAISYSKSSGERTGDLVFLEGESIITGDYGGNASQDANYVLFAGGVYSIKWGAFTSIDVSGLSQKVKAGEELRKALAALDEVFSKDPKSLKRNYRFKGIFGPMFVPAPLKLKKLEFKNANLLITFNDASSEYVLELDSNFGYVASSAAGKKVDPATVTAVPVETASEKAKRLQKIDDEAKARKAPKPK